MTPEDINKTAWEVWARSRKEVMCADQVAILAAALMEERERREKPVAHAYVIDGECEEIGWGEPPLEDPSLVLLSVVPGAAR